MVEKITTLQDLKAMKEGDLQKNVIKMARLLGWNVYHTFDSRKSEPGFPDLCMMHHELKRIIFAELKTEKGKVTEAQEAWLNQLYDVAQESNNVVQVKLWRPHQWATGAIDRALKGGG